MPPARSPITQRALATALNLSTATVSLALRDSPEIPPATRRRVRTAAKRLGYQPNPAAAQLARLKHAAAAPPTRAVLAWLRLWPNPALPRYGELDAYWRGACVCAERSGYRLEEFVCDDQLPPRRLLGILRARGIPGIIIPPSGRNALSAGFATTNAPSLDWSAFSLVKIGRALPALPVHLVTSDQVSNAMLAFRQARLRGYERVGIILSHCHEWGVLFEAGFLMARQRLEPALRLPLLSLRVIDPSQNRADIAAWLREQRPDVVLTDIAEVAAYLRDLGRRVPDDLGLVAMSLLDGKADAGIDQNPAEIGRVALLLLHSLIQDQSCGLPAIQREILVKGSWHDGSTLPDRTGSPRPATREA